jgi:hypothetical protein
MLRVKYRYQKNAELHHWSELHCDGANARHTLQDVQTHCNVKVKHTLQTLIDMGLGVFQTSRPVTALVGDC